MAFPHDIASTSLVVEGLRELARTIEENKVLVVRGPDLEVRTYSGPALVKFSFDIVCEIPDVADRIKKLFNP